MSEPDKPAPALDDCGCCEGIAVATPLAVDNRPGLTAIAYRVGTHPDFKETLVARLSDSSRPALRRLNTRDADDFSVSLLDAWATVADVLTFYQERIANESYLRTATERRSILELARLIGYEPSAGVAASAHLAFTLEDAPGAAGQALALGLPAGAALVPAPPAVIAVGTKAQSVPGQGETAQIFETVEEIEARPAWNALRPRLAWPQRLSTGMRFVIFRGTATNLKPGDVLLVVAGAGASSRATKTVLGVTKDDEADLTRVDFENIPPALPRYEPPTGLAAGQAADFAPETPLDEDAVERIISKKWDAQDLSALAGVRGWPVDQLEANINEQAARRATDDAVGVFALRARAAVFGHNAPRWDSLPGSLRYGEQVKDSTGKPINVPAAYPADWEGRLLEEDAGVGAGRGSVTAVTGARASAAKKARRFPGDSVRSSLVFSRRFVWLDNAYPQIVKGGWAVLRAPSGEGFKDESYAVIDNVELTRSDFTLSLKVSRLTLGAGEEFSSDFKVRTTSVLAQSERLAPGDLPIEDEVGGNSLTLGRAHLRLKVGRKVILTGERADLEGVYASELLTLKEVAIEAGYTVLTFVETLAHTYLRKSVTINANVAFATHGETVSETLGGGDATQSFQRFTLRQPPLTYVPAATPSGSETTLEVRVNDILWGEVPTLYGHGPEERVYVTRAGDDGKTTVQFGDGVTGARLPTGQDNVAAKYRRGTGTGGILPENRLTQLLTRPLSLKGVTNPLAAAGAEDPEARDAARQSAPLTVLTLDRIVSLRDYEDFAAAFSGVAKALATWTWEGERRGVFVTVAGPEGAEIADGSPLHTNLITAMRAAGDPAVPLTVKTYRQRLFRLKANVRVRAGHLPEKVLPAVEAVLRAAYSFDTRAFGRPVTLGEIVADIHTVEGVVAVDVDELYRDGQTPALNPRLNAALPAHGPFQSPAAELLTLDPGPLDLEALR
jgi:hypothetical protein